MDNVKLQKLVGRPNFLKDHNFKYLEFSVTITERLAILREIGESLPQGKRKASVTEIINYIQTTFNEVLKDYHALQEGSAARNEIEDMAASLIFKEREIAHLTDINKKLTQRLKDAKS
jgi:hypothetical protein